MKTHHHCYRCHRMKPVEDFTLRSDTGKPFSMCKPCKADYNRRYSKKRRAGLTGKQRKPITAREGTPLSRYRARRAQREEAHA